MSFKYPVGTKLIAIDSTALLPLGAECTVVEPFWDETITDTTVSFIDADGEFISARDYNNEFFELAPAEADPPHLNIRLQAAIDGIEKVSFEYNSLRRAYKKILEEALERIKELEGK